MLKMYKINKKLLLIVVMVAICLQCSNGVFVGTLSAASLTHTMVRTDRMQTSQTTTGFVCAAASAAGAGTEASVKVTFPTGYTVSTTTSNWAIDVATTTGWPSGATAWPGVGTATAASGQDVTFPSSNITDTTTHCFNWTNAAALTTKSSATNSNTGVVTTQTSTPTAIDTSSYAIATIADDTVDVSAAVSPSFTFALGATSTSFTSNLTSASATATTGVTATVTTNATFGWVAWLKDSNAGLTSAAAAKTIASGSFTDNGTVDSITNGSEGYVVDVDLTTDASGGGTVSLDGDYNGTTANEGGRVTSSAFQTVATSSGTAGGSGDVITFVGKATIAGDTPAATDYADTWTIIGAGLF